MTLQPFVQGQRIVSPVLVEKISPPRFTPEMNAILVTIQQMAVVEELMEVPVINAAKNFRLEIFVRHVVCLDLGIKQLWARLAPWTLVRVQFRRRRETIFHNRAGNR